MQTVQTTTLTSMALSKLGENQKDKWNSNIKNNFNKCKPEQY